MATDKGGNQLMKGFIVAMLLLTVVAAAALWYFYEGEDNSLANLEASQLSVLKKAREIRYYLEPSLSDYHSRVIEGTIKGFEDVDKSETEEDINTLLEGTYEFSSRDYNTVPISKPASGSKKKYVKRGVKVILYKVSRQTYQDILRDLQDKFGSYATIPNIKMRFAKNYKLPDLNGTVSETDIMWEVEITLVWYDRPTGQA